MVKNVNNVFLMLILKINVTSFIVDHRPIACLLVLY